MENRFCGNCGNSVPADAQFCSKCGKSVATIPVVPPPTAAKAVVTKPVVTKPAATQPPAVKPAPAVPPDARPQNSKSWIWVPAIMIGLIVVLWAVLAGMPFGGDDDTPIRPSRPQVDVIAERAAPPNTATIVETTPPSIPAESTPPLLIPEPPAATQTAPQNVPPMTSAAPPPARTVPPPVATPVPSTPVPTTPVQPVQRPAPKPTPQPVERERDTAEISESQAMALLRNYIGSRDQYGSSVDCVTVGSEGYKNRGYTLFARDRCDGHTFGRWRVDSVTREVFREKSDGRFLRP